MSTNTFGNQNAKLADRMNRRRQIRSKNGLDKSSMDDSDITSLKSSSTTLRSLDRTSSKQTNHPLSLSSSTSSAMFKNRELTPIDNSDVKQNHRLTEQKSEPIPVLEQLIKSQPLDTINERETSAQSSSAAKQQIDFREDTVPAPVASPEINEIIEPVKEETISVNLPPVISPRTIKVHQPVQSETEIKSHSYPNDEPSSPKLPPIIAPRTSRKPNPFQRITHKHPILQHVNDYSQTSLDYPSSDPQNTTNNDQKHFDFPSTNRIPMARSTSEQIVSASQHRHESTNTKSAKQNSLALSYIFNKRIIDTEFTSISSLNSEESSYKTMWD